MSSAARVPLSAHFVWVTFGHESGKKTECTELESAGTWSLETAVYQWRVDEVGISIQPCLNALLR